MEITLLKNKYGALEAADEETKAWLEKQPVGQALHGEFKKVRNYRFHKKAFSLFRLAFDLWEPVEIQFKGQPVQKEFEQFRKDLTILAGFYDPVYHLNNTLELKPKSLSFGSMDEDEFERVFKAILAVIWEKVLRNHQFESPEAVNQTVEALLGYE